jgi:hypothetical protein
LSISFTHQMIALGPSGFDQQFIEVTSGLGIGSLLVPILGDTS